MQLWLSSNVLQTTLGTPVFSSNPLPFNSFTRFITPITSRRAVDRAMYSASVVLKAMSVCIFEAHTIGHPAYMITKTVLECADKGSFDNLFCQEPAQSASTKHSKPLDKSGLNFKPLSFVRSKYRQILFTASSCSCLGSLQMHAHC